MSLVKKNRKKLFRFYLSNMEERCKEDENAYSAFERYIPTIGAMIIHEDSRIGEVDIMSQIDSFPVSKEEISDAFIKFGFAVQEAKEDEIIEKSFLGFTWSKDI
jgi:hypothetical protein